MALSRERVAICELTHYFLYHAVVLVFFREHHLHITSQRRRDEAVEPILCICFRLLVDQVTTANGLADLAHSKQVLVFLNCIFVDNLHHRIGMTILFVSHRVKTVLDSLEVHQRTAKLWMESVNYSVLKLFLKVPLVNSPLC